MIRESQSYLKWSGKDKESWACVVNVVVLYCSTVLGRKISFLAKGSIKNVMTLTKINMILMIWFGIVFICVFYIVVKAVS